MKILSITAVSPALLSPIITLASCSKAASTDPIVIEEKEKTKDLESGKRQVAYLMKFDSPVAADEQVTASAEDITSSQEGYTVAVSNVKFTAGSEAIEINVDIVPTQNEILKEGAEFKFSLLVKRVKDGKETLSTKIEGFKMVYATVTKGALTLNGQPKVYSNPGSPKHTFVYTVGAGMEIPDDAEYECDITNKKCSPDTDIAFCGAKLNKTIDSLEVQFMLTGDELTEDSYADFDYTLSCKKDGSELWRQSFTGYEIKYLDNLLWIYDEYQWTQTYAGDDTFYLYVVKDESIDKWGEDWTIQFSNVTEGYGLSVDTTKITIGSIYYSFFIIPIKVEVTGSPTTKLVNYDFKIRSAIEQIETPDKEPFTDRKIEYVKRQIVEPSSTIKQIDIAGDTKTQEVEFTFESGYDQPNSFDFLIIPIDHSEDANVTHGDPIPVSTTGFKLPMTINTSSNKANVSFSLIIYGLDSNGGIMWEQLINKFSINYLDPFTFKNVSIETDLDSYVGKMYYDLETNTTITNGDFVENSKKFPTGNITEISKTEDHSNKCWNFTFTPKDSTQLTYKDYATFGFKVQGTTLMHKKQVSWTKTFNNCKMTYSGSIKLSSETGAELTTEAGKMEVTYEFDKLCKTNDITAEIIKPRCPKNYSVEITNTEVKGEKVYVTVKMLNSLNIFENSTKCSFNFKFTATDSQKTLWTKTDSHDFSITYAPAIIPLSTEEKTKPTETSFKLQLRNFSKLSNNQYYTFNVESQSSPTNTLVTIDGDKKYTPDVDSFTVEATLTNKDKQPLKNDDNVSFDILINKYDSDGTLMFKERFAGFTATYCDALVQWDNSIWYATSPVETNTVDINCKFNLNYKLGEGETLECGPLTVTGTSVSNVTASCEQSPTISEKTLTVKITLKKDGEGFLVSGDYAIFDIPFKCKKDGNVVWEWKVTNCYVALFAQLTPEAKTVTTVGGVTNIVLNASAKLLSQEQTPVMYPIVNNVVSKPEGCINVYGENGIIDDYKITFPHHLVSKEGYQIKAGDNVKFNITLLIDLVGPWGALVQIPLEDKFTIKVINP